VEPSEIESLKAAGADDFIKKPFDVGQLVDRMVELLTT
jgi:DNA-binding response OmpR family regulator